MTTDTTGSVPQKHSFNLATILPAAIAILIVALHGLTYLLSFEENVALHYDFALAPRRFFAPSGSEHAYPNTFAQILTLVSSALLHGEWVHVLVNAFVLWQFGQMPARVLGLGLVGAGKWLLLFLVSVAAGSLTYLLINGANGGAAVGASGGTCGLIAAYFLVGPDGGLRSPASRSFLVATLGFAIVNALLVFVVPLVLPIYAGWESHLGGYVAGAAMMLILGAKARGAETA